MEHDSRMTERAIPAKHAGPGCAGG